MAPQPPYLPYRFRRHWDLSKGPIVRVLGCVFLRWLGLVVVGLAVNNSAVNYL